MVMVTRATQQAKSEDLCDLVFGIDLLRETIIDYAIHDYDIEGRFCVKNALSCRLVQKSWMESVFKCFAKSGTPLVSVELESLSELRDFASFLEICQPASRLPFKLTATFECVNFEQYLKSLEKCLHLCGGWLIELDLGFFLNVEFLENKDSPLRTFTNQRFTLPVLQKLTYYVPHHPVVSTLVEVNGDIHINSALQSILSGCLRLKYFEFFGSGFDHDPLPANFGNLLLPATMTNLELKGELRTGFVETLMRSNNEFPKLNDLTLYVPNASYGAHQWVNELLIRVCDTLKKLFIDGGGANVTREELEMVYVDPPVMKSLQEICIFYRNFEWDERATNLHRKLPALRKIDIQCVTSTSLRRWTLNSKFDILTDVCITYCYFAPSADRDVLTIKDAQLMSQAFPNVRKLKIFTTCRGNVNQFLQCLFQNMTQLQLLKIILREFRENPIHSRYLDALLLGIPCELIETLKTECVRGKLWEAVLLRMDKQLSIANLTELRELRLEIKTTSDPTFVSEKVREFVVSTMPNLEKINLTRPLPPLYPEGDILRWNQTGRVFCWD